MKAATALLMAVPYVLFVVFAIWFWLRRRKGPAPAAPGDA